MRYAFDKYDQLFVPEFNAGAMENAGCVTFREDYVFRSKVTDARRERRGETILHEMAHMWFGDLVTMRWWDDLWLNESFATYAAALCQAEATRWKNAWTTFANVEKTWAYRQDQQPTTHPIASDAPDVQTAEVNFDGITYAKGASVLKQLAAYVGIEQFLAGVREYFTEHAYGNTTLGDLLGALERSSGPRARLVVEVVARDDRHQHDPPGVHPRRRGPLRELRPRPGRADTMSPRRMSCVRTGSPIGVYNDDPETGNLVRTAARRTRRDRRAHPGRATRRHRRSPRCCWSTTTTSPTASCAWTSAACARCARAASPGWPTRCRARCAGRRRGT